MAYFDHLRKLSARWKAETRTYVSAQNARTQAGIAIDWDIKRAPPEGLEKVTDTREDMADEVLDVVRKANAAGFGTDLREHFPPAYSPILPAIKKKSISFNFGVWVDDQTVLAYAGTAFRPYKAYALQMDGSAEEIPGVVAMGTSADRAHVALVTKDGINIHTDWQKPPIRTLALPSGVEGIDEKYKLLPTKMTEIKQVEPIEHGQAAMIVIAEGVFLSSEDGVRRVYPSDDYIENIFAEDLKIGEPSSLYQWDMIHAAICESQGLIAAGHQSSQHDLITFDGEQVAEFGPVHKIYPHHTAFSPDGQMAFFNSCHFYNGATVATPVEDLRGFHHPEYENEERLVKLEPTERVHCSTFLDDEIVLGTSGGDLHARTFAGEYRWHHHCGSTVSFVDVNPSGTHLAVGTAAGFCEFIELNAGGPDPYQLGDSPHREILRFVCWKDEPLLRW